MKIIQLLEALKPSQYRPLVKNWDRERYKDIFLNPEYAHDRKGYRVFIPFKTLSFNEYDLANLDTYHVVQTLLYDDLPIKYKTTPADYIKGYAYPVKDGTMNKSKPVKIGKLLGKIKESSISDVNVKEYINKFANDPIRAGSSEENYITVISRHPYDIGGMSTDRGWTSCMNLETGGESRYILMDVKYGTLIAYCVKQNDPDIKNPVCRVLIKPFMNVTNHDLIYFGIENRVYGEPIYNFIETVKQWVDEVNNQNKLDGVAIVDLHPALYHDSPEEMDEYYDDEEDEYYEVDPNTEKLVFQKGLTDKEKSAFETVHNNPIDIRKVINQVRPENREKLQLFAVSLNGNVIQYPCFNNSSEKVKMAAIKQNYGSLRFIENQSEKLQLFALKEHPYSMSILEHLKNPSERVQMIAVSMNGHALRYINNPSEKLQLAAVNSPGQSSVIGTIKNPSERVKLAAVKQSGMALQYIKNQSEELQLAAVKSQISYAQRQNSKWHSIYTLLAYCDNPSKKVIKMAIDGYSNPEQFARIAKFNLTPEQTAYGKKLLSQKQKD